MDRRGKCPLFSRIIGRIGSISRSDYDYDNDSEIKPTESNRQAKMDRPNHPWQAPQRRF